MSTDEQYPAPAPVEAELGFPFMSGDTPLATEQSDLGGYPEPTRDDEEVSLRVKHFLDTTNKAELTRWTEEHAVVHELAGRAFRMLVDIPPESDRSAIVVFGGAGNGLDSMGAIARARVIRMMVNPSATLVLQPNSTLGEPNMNFSREERKRLYAGSANPVVDRVLTTLETVGNPSDIVTYGPAQGGTVALAFAANQYAPGSIATTVVEVPSVTNRSMLRLGVDFAGSGGRLEKEKAGNFDPSAPLREELLADLGAVGLAKFGLGLLRPDNLALTGIMRRATAERDMETILEKGGSVVHAWATGGKVSPAEANLQIAGRLRDHPRYRGVPLKGADHSVTNDYERNARLVFYATVLGPGEERHYL